MGEVRRIGSIDIDQDLDAQRREWKASKIGWAVFSLFVAAGLLGVTGPGPLSHASAGDSAGPLRVEYSRFAHRHAPERLGVTAAVGSEATELRLAFPREYVEAIDIESIRPEPATVETKTDEIVYVFAPARGVAEITFSFRFERFGPIAGRIATGGGAALAFDQFVYP